jgi:hypothetical protein
MSQTNTTKIGVFLIDMAFSVHGLDVRFDGR